MKIKTRILKLENKNKSISKRDIISYGVVTITNVQEAMKNPYIIEECKDEYKK